MNSAVTRVPVAPTAARVWLADLTHTQQLVTSDVMPASIGGIATFTEAHVPLAAPIRLFKYPEQLAQALDAETPDVIGFSNYIWNFRLSYRFAEVIKQLNPATVVVFGGPNYPVIADEQTAFLSRHHAIDFYIVKEGEIGFSTLLRRLAEEGFHADAVKAGAGLPSVHWIAAGGAAELPHEAARITDLSVIPSPYLTGKLDEFFDGTLIPILQTNRGCPFQCTFCVEGGAYYSKVYRSSSEKIAAEIDYIGTKMAQRRVAGGRNDLYIADSNFGMYRQDLDTCRAIADSMERHGWPEYINTTTGKNQKERVLEAARLVKGALRLSGSVQSLDPTVLKNIKRANIAEGELLELAVKSSDLGANSYSEIILGLPGDSLEAHRQSLRTIVNAGFKNVYTWHLMLLPGSELDTEETRANYQMVTKFRVLPRCYGAFTVRGIPVVASEIEEVCVASSTLSFDDYLTCRKLHLIIATFYNDAVFGSLVKLLKLLDVSAFQWLDYMSQVEVGGRLRELFDRFQAETRAELWDDFDELATFADRPENVARYIDGEIGYNLLFSYKTLALTTYAPEVSAFARDTVTGLLRAERKLTPEVDAFIADAVTYVSSRLANLFTDRDQPVRATLQHDIPAFEAAETPRDLQDYVLLVPIEYRFELTASQHDMIARYLNIYGASVVGIARILMKLYVNKLFRHAVRGETHADSPATAYVISGLQDSMSG
jgi:radical SAM superfamily enzyme YgiQ (UPF0313 family)